MSDQDLKEHPGQADPASEGTKPLFTVGDRAYTAEDAKKKIENADPFIETLKTEAKQKDDVIASLKAQLDQQQSIDEKLSKALEAMNQNGGRDMSDHNDNTSQVDIEGLQAALLKKAEEVSLQSVNQFQQQQLATANQTESMQAAQKIYGSEYETKLREKGAELGLDDNAIVKMAEGNPKLFKQVFGLDGKGNVNVAPDGSQGPYTSNLQKPEFKSVKKQWGGEARVAATRHNMSQVEKMIADANGDIDAVARTLGVRLTNPVNS